MVLQVLLSQNVRQDDRESLVLLEKGTGLAEGPEMALGRGVTSDTLSKVELNSLIQLGDFHPSSQLKSNCWRSGEMAVD